MSNDHWPPCQNCGAYTGCLPYDWSGAPKCWGCFDCEPVTFWCDACIDAHRQEVHGDVVRRAV